jgi:hypothetical protein
MNNLPNTLTKCAPCADSGLTRLAVEVMNDTPLCGPCAYEVRMHRLLADLSVDEPARLKVPVPAMPPVKGDACCWGCTPEAIEPECLLHGHAGDSSRV